MKEELTILFKGISLKAAALSLLVLLVLGILTFKQWLDGPIVIRPFTVVEDASTAGISATTLADQTKAHISAIYSASGNLFQTRKLGEPTLPLDIKIGDTGWTFQSLTNAVFKAFGMALTSADISGRIVKDGQGLSLQWTTVKTTGIAVDKFPIPPSHASPLENVDTALDCLALRTVAELSPDVAANYLHKQGEVDGKKTECLAQDVVELYSRVSKDEARPPAARVNALVGLSVHYSYFHQWFEELSMAEAATQLASRTLSCDDRNALPLRWQRFKCRVNAYRRFGDHDLRAEIAAWMQLGAARSDYARAASTLKEMNERRRQAIEAYNHVIAIKGDYALAYDAKGLQLRLLNKPLDAAQEYRRSLAASETSPAHIDLAMLRIHGNNESLNEQDVSASELRDAKIHFLRAIELSPDYWYAYGALGYVLYKTSQLGDAVDVLETAVQHDEANRSLRLLLGSVYAGLCRFDDAKAKFESAYGAYVDDHNIENALNVVSDWGKVLHDFGLTDAAIAQESEVLASKPNHVDALRIRGEIRIETAGTDPVATAAGLKDLKAAFDNDPSKSDTVLSAYLDGLVQAGRAGDAIEAYEAWSRLGLVPPLINASISDAAILPATPNARLAYAKALLKNHQWEGASREFSVLFGLGVTPHARVSAELRAQAEDTGVANASLMRVGMWTSGTPALATHAESKHECHLPPLPRPRLLLKCAACGSNN